MTDELQQLENWVETNIVQPVENFLHTNPVAVAVETDLETAFKNALSLVERNGGQLLFNAAVAAAPDIVSGNWTAVATDVLTAAKASGASTISQEEGLAASTALQIAQVIAPNAVSAPMATDTSEIPASSVEVSAPNE